MILAKTSRRVWCSKKIDGFPAGAMLEVALQNGDTLVAFDPIGCGLEESVLLVTGGPAERWLSQPTDVADAVIVGIVDSPKSKD